LPKRIATFAVLKTLAALLLGSGLAAAAAHSTDAPDNVEAEVAEAVQSCKDLDGAPNADAVLSTKDVNGDGGEDWIADYSKLSCKGGINQMCDVEGCVLQIYLWNGSTAWNLAFDEAVKSYKFAKHRGQHLLQVVMAGSACDKPASATCRMTYILNEDTVDLAR
jgi:hypothetical protein